MEFCRKKCLFVKPWYTQPNSNLKISKKITRNSESACNRFKIGDGASVSIINTGFSDNDTSLMTSQAIKEKIEDYGYTTNTGDMTGVDLTGGTGIAIASESNTTSGNYSATINCNLEGTELKSTGESGGNKFLREDGDGTC